MNQDKINLLNYVLDRVANIGFGLEPMDRLDDFFAEKLMIIGTAADEKHTSLAGLRKLLEHQQEQMQGMDVRFARSEIYRDFSADENIAISVDDITVFLTVNTGSIQFDVRSSAVLEFKNQHWKLVHYHASKPDPVESEVDTFGIEKWKQKAEELEKLVAERTADLVKKNRELEIEASLERVRTVAMAMNEPADMLTVCKIIAGQLQLLGVNDIRNVQTAIFYEAKGTYMNYEYYARHDKTIITEANYTTEKTLKAFARKMLKGKNEVYTTHLTGKKLADWLAYQETANVFVDPFLTQTASLHYYWYALGPIAMGMSSYAPLRAEDLTLFKRFHKVFDLTYRRYLDIEKAQAQTREAQIEAALEKIRSRSLAMHKSDELIDVVNVVFEKLQELKMVFDGGTSIVTFIDGSKDSIVWVADLNLSTSRLSLPYPKNDMSHHTMISDFWNAKENGIDFYAQAYSFEEKNTYFNYVFSVNKQMPDEAKIWLLGTKNFAQSVALTKNAGITISSFTGKLLSVEQNSILKRIAKVFEQAYIRFLDLQKAEAQAREAQVELCLEKVRSRSMAMHQSHELAEAASVLFQQIKELGYAMWSCGFCIWQQDDVSELWMSADSGGLLPPMRMPYKKEPTHRKIYEASLRQEPMHEYIWEGDELAEHYEFLYTIPSVKEAIDILKKSGLSLPVKQCYYTGFFKQGYLLIITKEPTPEMRELSYRFTRVFEQTYTRFLDLQKAEAQAREAQIEVALERVRARSLAMHHSSELEQVAGALFGRMAELGLSFDGALIFTFEKEKRNIKLWLATNHLSDPTLIELPYDIEIADNPIIKHLWSAVENGENIIRKVYSGEPKNDYFRYVSKYNSSKVPEAIRQIQLETEYWNLFCVAEKNSMVGFDSWSGHVANDEELQLLKRVAKVFEQAYIRFLDLQKAEALAELARQNLILIQKEKQRAEDALTELKNTQNQLIQKEKLASLGELTAGIAHEIQNPLNFVNNFSEVSSELVDELKEEALAGHTDDVLALADDLAQNLQKITHHGGRASSIVKGMLEHSRTSSGEKQPTNLNALADEYLKIAYHGLRAKDNAFNCELVTEFDPTLGKVDLIPQDIGRVLLNLYNNAFYAVSAKQKTAPPNYQPTVTVSTRLPDSAPPNRPERATSIARPNGLGNMGGTNTNGTIEIHVSDNGTGISNTIKAKIFQPFFTTKPTGEGTGLGLSLSYDIVTKGHGGTLQVASTVGEGSVFIITLPQNALRSTAAEALTQ